ncbi:hypothetical protein ACLM5J_15315 [Nocardioides sp. Bht2]|uniref:hypothetical protein n=1 Tax=Nocardioides sp. Bht2 TaxID=3392297 RepID=UPI0039B6BF09
MGKLLLLLIVIAVVIYLVVRTVETRGHPFRRAPGSRPFGGGNQARPIAPDDDAEFLRDLNRRRKKRDPDSPE